MTNTLTLMPSTFSLKNGTRKVFDAALLTCALVHAAQLTITGQTIDFPDPTHDNAYYWSGSGAPANPVSESAAAYVTLLAEERSFTDILLGNIPVDTDYLDVQANITRTTNPSSVFGDTVKTVVPQGKAIVLLGGSCLLEETNAFSRGFSVIPLSVSATVAISIASPGVITWTAHGLVAGNTLKLATTGALPTGLVAGTVYFVKTVIDANNFTVAASPGGTVIATTGSQLGVQTGSIKNAYLRRYQSVGPDTQLLGINQQWSATNNASDSAEMTWGTTRGQLVGFSSGTSNYIPPTNFTTGGIYTHKRGGASQVSLTDTLNFHSVYSANFVITPGRFVISPTIVAPATKTAVRLTSLSAQFGAGASNTFTTVPFGIADGTRQILVAISSRASTSASETVSSVTIGGVSATKLKEGSDAFGNVASIWMAAVPTGTSGTVAVTYGINTTNVVIAVYALYHLASTTPVNTQSTTTSASAVTLTTSAGGFAFAASMHQNTAPSGTLPNRTMSGIANTGFQATNGNSGGFLEQHEFGFQPTTGASLSVSFTFNNSGALAACSLS